jgi:hypothetical protein
VTSLTIPIAGRKGIEIWIRTKGWGRTPYKVHLDITKANRRAGKFYAEYPS